MTASAAYTVIACWAVCLVAVCLVAIASASRSREKRRIAEKRKTEPRLVRIRIVQFHCNVCDKPIEDGDLAVRLYSPSTNYTFSHVGCVSNGTLSSVIEEAP